MANASGDSAKNCEKVINETNLLHNLSKYSESGFAHLIDEEIAYVMVWLIENIAKYFEIIDIGHEKLRTVLDIAANILLNKSHPAFNKHKKTNFKSMKHLISA